MRHRLVLKKVQGVGGTLKVLGPPMKTVWERQLEERNDLRQFFRALRLALEQRRSLNKAVSLAIFVQE